MLFSRSTLLSFLTLLPYVHAFPSGAQSCPLGSAAPANFHTSGPAIVTTLDESGFTVTLDGDLIVGETRMLTLTGTERTFRGFLVRLEGDGDLEPIGTLSQIAMPCGTVPGVTHTSRDDKSMIQIFVTPLTAGEMLLDVSVVESNNASEGNVYSYSQIAVTASDAAAEAVAVVTDAPVVAPPVTEAPVATVVVATTEAPVAAVVVTEAPVVVAVVPETEAPVAAVVPETEAPVVDTTPPPPMTGEGPPPPPPMMMNTTTATATATEAPVAMNATMTDAPMNTTTDAPTEPPMMMETNATDDEAEDDTRDVDYNESGAATTRMILVGLLSSVMALFWM